ncbi:MAG: type 4a pilus biogenesis protein PilO [Candidatus Omnitrophota bacterium]|nr:type 4a pilus biogenesis protein PilO [Candidatus Omnitrophota bacterium]
MQINLGSEIDLGSLFKKQWVVLPAITFIVTLLIGINVYKAQMVKLELVKQKTEEESKVGELINLIKLQDDRFSVYKKIYSLKEPDFIMQEISKLASDSDVRLLSLTPSGISKTAIFQFLPLTMRIQGSYHRIGKFIEKIEASAYALKIISFQLNESGASSREEEVLDAAITIYAISLAE